MRPLRRELDVAVDLARAAAEAVMRVYAAGPVKVEFKGPDDPVTRADRESNALLVDGLTRAFPGVPIVAEESPASDYAGWQAADACWFVDPLDGTREFVDRNGEFAVMVGLAIDGRAVLGVVDECAHGRRFAAAEGVGAFEIDAAGAWSPMHVSANADVAKARIVSSRSRPSPLLAEVLARAGAPGSRAIGSCGVKGARVATGEADAYVHIEQAGYRWDACATEALVVCAGGRMTDAKGARIDYRASSLANSNGLFASNGTALHDVILEALLR